MGTRNLTMVIADGETKVAQYGQWDGYPEGQGLTALRFLQSNDLESFKKKLSNVRFLNQQDEKEKGEFLKSIGAPDGWLNEQQNRAFNLKYPYLSRDHGADVLKMIMDADNEVLLEDMSEFVTDSLFCEWACVIDFGKSTFEVYEGFNKEPLAEGERFKEMPVEEGSEYYPVKLRKSYQLDGLPTEGDFLNDFRENKKEEK